MKVFDRTCGKPAAQGDVLIMAVDWVPKGYEKTQPENNQHIITHSETGHHHTMKAKHVDFFQAANDPFTAYIVVKETTDLIHNRGHDTHETHRYPPGAYRISRQAEETPTGWERVAD